MRAIRCPRPVGDATVRPETWHSGASFNTPPRRSSGSDSATAGYFSPEPRVRTHNPWICERGGGSARVRLHLPGDDSCLGRTRRNPYTPRGR